MYINRTNILRGDEKAEIIKSITSVKYQAAIAGGGIITGPIGEARFISFDDCMRKRMKDLFGWRPEADDDRTWLDYGFYIFNGVINTVVHVLSCLYWAIKNLF